MSKKRRIGQQSYICVHCGDQFFANHPSALYCGEACSKAEYRIRKNATKTGLEGFTAIDIETFNLIRSASESAGVAIMHTRRVYGLEAARVALWGCWGVLMRDDIDPREMPYSLKQNQVSALKG